MSYGSGSVTLMISASELPDFAVAHFLFHQAEKHSFAGEEKKQYRVLHAPAKHFKPANPR